MTNTGRDREHLTPGWGVRSWWLFWWCCALAHAHLAPPLLTPTWAPSPAPQDLPSGQDWRWQQGKKPRQGGGGGEPAQPILGRPGVTSDPACCVTARNVAFRATEADIVAFFTQAGTVGSWVGA